MHCRIGGRIVPARVETNFDPRRHAPYVGEGSDVDIDNGGGAPANPNPSPSPNLDPDPDPDPSFVPNLTLTRRAG